MRTFPLIKRKSSRTSVPDYLHLIWDNGTFAFTIGGVSLELFLKGNNEITSRLFLARGWWCCSALRIAGLGVALSAGRVQWREGKRNKAGMLKRRSFIPQRYLSGCTFSHSVLLLNSLSHFKIGPWKWMQTRTLVRARIASNTSRKIFLSGTWISNDPARISASTTLFTISLMTGCWDATCCLWG